MRLSIRRLRFILLMCSSGILVVMFHTAFTIIERREASDALAVQEYKKEAGSHASLTMKTLAAVTLDSASSMATATASSSSSVPKILWLYWDKGMDHLKEMSESTESTDLKKSKYKTGYACVQAWKILHPTWDVRILNLTEAKRFAPNFAKLIDDGNENNTPICPVKLCDLLRLELLTRYGGVYVDTSVCPMRPLDDFIDKLVGGSHQGFFAPPLGSLDRGHGKFVAGLERSQLDRFVGCDSIASANSNASSHGTIELAKNSRSLATWFLVASPHHTLVEQWMWAYYKLLTDLLQSDCAQKCHNYGKPTACVCACVPYFVAHCIFTLQRWHQESVEAIWTEFRAHANKNNAFWASDKDEGVCSGWSPSTKVNKNVTLTRKMCYVAKKQHENLAEFVTSPAYLESMVDKVGTPI